MLHSASSNQLKGEASRVSVCTSSPVHIMAAPGVPCRSVARTRVLEPGLLVAFRVIERPGWLCYCEECQSPIRYRVLERDFRTFKTLVGFTHHGVSQDQWLPLKVIGEREPGDFGSFSG